MHLLSMVVLGIVQGITEFLPISSSGHLILAREVLGLQTDYGLAVDAVLQLGTILSVYVYFHRDLWKIGKSLIQSVRHRETDGDKKNQQVFWGIVLGTLPALVLGVLLEHFMETTFRSAFLVALMLLAGSGLLLFAEHVAKKIHDVPSLKQAWWIGLFQTLALVPGVSRSGATISGGLIMGLTREAATRFSFLLSLPIITGAGLKKVFDLYKMGWGSDSMISVGVGFFVAFIVGLFAIRFLLNYLKSHSLRAFVWYRCILAVGVLVFLFVRLSF